MFGPPQRFTIASTCSWLGHSVSGLRHDTSHPFQIRFRFGFVTLSLNLASHRNSPARSTKSTTSHSCGAMSACKHMVSGSLSLPSRGAFHLSLTVLCAIGSCRVFSLGQWSARIPSGFHVSRRTQVRARAASVFAYGAFTLSRRPSQTVPLTHSVAFPRALQPRMRRRIRFRLLPLRSPLLWESIYLSTPAGT